MPAFAWDPAQPQCLRPSEGRCLALEPPTLFPWEAKTHTQDPRRRAVRSPAFNRPLPAGKRLEQVQLQLSAESVGEVYIKSTQSGQYLAMDTNGLLYGSLLGEECLFLERIEENHYNTYTSKKHADKNWFVGLKKNGNSKLGPRTHYGQKAILFLPLPVSAD
ncbi:fibroblast growth factor 1 isoform 2-T2 [Morphnus guianensis]